eukprot:SAG31_NODE_7586_length_1647_cov_1.270026_2_plen_105_part_00
MFFDPPWGGEGYGDRAQVELFLSGQSLASICARLAGKAEYIALKLPHNFNFGQFFREASSRKAGGFSGHRLQELRREGMFGTRDGRPRGYPGEKPKFVLMILRC